MIHELANTNVGNPVQPLPFFGAKPYTVKSINPLMMKYRYSLVLLHNET